MLYLKKIALELAYKCDSNFLDKIVHKSERAMSKITPLRNISKYFNIPSKKYKRKF